MITINGTGRQLADLDDVQLAERCTEGQEAAISELYARHFDSVYGYARIALQDHHEAEDVTQQVFTSILEKLPGYQPDPKRPFRAWLFTITRNRVIDVGRKRRRLRVEEPEQIAASIGVRDGHPTSSILGWLSDSELALLVERLPETQREVLTLHYLLDLTFEEVAPVVDRSVAAVYKLHTRALRTLEERLGALGRSSQVRARRRARPIALQAAPALAR